MNDPNGMLVRDGVFHLFYQHEPDVPRWGRIHWAHAVSVDLAQWHELPIALSPAGVGPDDLGCWSGCIVDGPSGATMFYTGVTLDGSLRRASICRATSGDGLTSWVKDPAGPCILGAPDGIGPDAFRDPFVFRHGQGWGMLVGAGTTEGMGAVLLFRSSDQRTWLYVGQFLGAAESLGPGADGPVWECPQLLRFDDVAVLIVSVVDRTPGVRPSHVAAFVGRVDSDRFVVEHIEELGMGPDFYAPATTVMPDGRNLLFGWVPEDPPRDGSTRDWAGSMTFPRVVSIAQDGRLSLALAAEVTAIRGRQHQLRDIELGDELPAWRWDAPTQHFEIVVLIDPQSSHEVLLSIVDDGATEDPEACVTFRPPERILDVARRGIVSVAGRSSHNARVLPEAGTPTTSMRIIVDGSIIELEIDGRTMATMRRSAHPLERLSVTLEARGGRVRVPELTIWDLTMPGGGGYL